MNLRTPMFVAASLSGILGIPAFSGVGPVNDVAGEQTLWAELAVEPLSLDSPYRLPTTAEIPPPPAVLLEQKVIADSAERLEQTQLNGCPWKITAKVISDNKSESFVMVASEGGSDVLQVGDRHAGAKLLAINPSGIVLRNSNGRIKCDGSRQSL